jgi:hypothetical protein
MVEPVLGLTVLTVAGLSTGIALLPLPRVVWTSRVWLLGTGGRSVVALRVLIVRLRRRLQLVSFIHASGGDEFYTVAVGVCG